MSEAQLPTEIRIAGHEDYYRNALAQVAEVQAGPNREAGVVLVLEAGTYTLNLNKKGLMDSSPLDMTVRGEGEVWFEGAGIDLQARNVTVSNIGFRGRTSGVFLSLSAKGDVAVSDLRFENATAGSRYTPFVPAKGQQGRGAKPRPGYLVEVSTMGEGRVDLGNLVVRNSSTHPGPLIKVNTRGARNVVVQGLQVEPDTGENPIEVSPGSTLTIK